MSPSADRLVGRAAELESLDQALAELRRRRPGTLLLAGEPGIGKTRLLAELQARADANGWLVLAGSASELERELPFWIFVDALDEYVRALEPGRLDAMDVDTRGELAHVLPSLPAGTELPPERYRAHRAMRQLLEALAQEAPMLLVLDDVHWADPGSIDLLGSLLRRPPEGVLIAIAVRPRQLPERLQGPLERARNAGTLAWLELGPLSADDARELLGGDAFNDVLYGESRGNPFYLQQLARFPEARTVTAALAEELALLSDAARRVLEGAAVAGDPFEPELAAAAAGVRDAGVIDALDELVGADLVRPTEVPRRFRFRHPLVRSAVYETAAAGWRLGAHERAAAELAARGAPPLERAHHLERSARQGDAEAAAILRAAGEATALRAPAIATRWFEAALRLLPADAEARLELLTALAGASASIGRFEEARAAALEALSLAPSIERVAAVAGFELVLGDHARARARLAAAVDELPDGESPAAAAVMLALAHSHVFTAQYAPMRDWAARALDVARELGDRRLVASAAAMLALANAFLGSVAAAEAACAEAAGLVDAMSDEELAGLLDAAANLAAAEFYLDRLENAGAHAEHAHAVGRASGHGDLFLVAYGIIGNIRLARGDVGGAVEFYDAAVDTTRLFGNPQLLAWTLVNRSLVASVAGDGEAALALFSESAEFDGALHGVAAAWSGLAHAAALLESGDAAHAEEAVAGAVGADELPALPGGTRARGLELLTRCRLALGRRADAARSAAAARGLAQTTGLPLTTAMADLAEGALALEDGDGRRAADLALSAAALAEGAGAVLDGAVARTLAGRALATAGDADGAAAQLERAAAVFEACGATRRRDAAERDLGRLGRRRHRRTRPGTGVSGIDALTARERQVARLIVDRRTNSEIAAELFLSTKTVETHIRNLFYKLNVSSRADVARAVERADRAAS
jgi:DNA-binding CsgD family transcriptional regulator/tetratricopeptide (TPR) repeat protein